MSKASELLPEPDTPVTTTSSPVAMVRSRFLRLFWRAPTMRIWELMGRNRSLREDSGGVRAAPPCGNAAPAGSQRPDRCLASAAASGFSCCINKQYRRFS
ncbi:Uncharacterised protein [Bordetella pertussis]|nr:Uncharacterised protein [Bordetella pertussis]CFW38559.1 Uncharacterised protein [Bordetella pertussis]